MGNMNVTPFIDVLLVMLIMIVLAVPIKTNIAKLDLPTDACFDCTVQESNSIVIDANDQLFWNGIKVTPDQLKAQITRATQTLPEAPLHFEPDALASYNRAAQTIVLIKEAGATHFAFVGNERYREFSR